MSMQEIFSRVATSRAAKGGNYLRDGKGRLIIDVWTCDNDKSVLECAVERSEKVVVVSKKTGQVVDVEPNQPGTSCAVVTKFTGRFDDPGPSNLKSQVLAVLGYDEGEIDADGLVKLMVEIFPAKGPSPCRGMVVDYETYRKISKQSNIELVLPKWRHVPLDGDNSKDKIAARKAKLDARAAEAPPPAPPRFVTATTPEIDKVAALEAELARLRSGK